jgi:uncharacterized protein involved in exopolysaccharide biosynthesis
MDSVTSPQRLNDELTFKELVELIHRHRWLIVLTTVVLTFIAASASLVMPKKYQASIVVSPVSDSAGSGLGNLGSMASEFNGLASLAGLSLGEGSKRAESLAVLQSEALTERYIHENNLLPVLFSSKWDPDRRAWRTAEPSKIPTLWQANQFFKRVRSIATDSKTGLVTLTIEWRDPQVAARWANDLVRLANDYLRTQAIDQSERNIAYLNEQARKTDVLPAQQAIYSLLQTVINKAMIARGSEEYAFKVLDPARAPERPSSPRKVLWTALGFLVGLFGSVLFVILRAAAT